MATRHRIGTAWRLKFLRDIRNRALAAYQEAPTPAGEMELQTISEMEELLTGLDKKGYDWPALVRIANDLPDNNRRRVAHQARLL